MEQAAGKAGKEVDKFARDLPATFSRAAREAISGGGGSAGLVLNPGGSGSSSSGDSEASDLESETDDAKNDIQEFYERIAELQRSLADDLSDIRREAERAEDNALRSRDFAAVFDQRETLTERLADRQLQYERDMRDAQLEQTQQFGSELISIHGQAYQQTLNMASQWSQNMQNLMSNSGGGLQNGGNNSYVTQEQMVNAFSQFAGV
jgi:hypothetical protein